MSIRKSRVLKRPKVFISVVVVAIALSGAGLYIAHRNHATGKTLQQKVITAIEKHMILPNNESPTLATITDTTKLSKNSFFSKAKNGDEVLVYVKNQKAVIYRPSLDRVVDVGPVITGTSSSPYVTSKVAILNGSGNPEKIQSVVTRLYAKFPNVTVVSKDVAPRNFPTTIVVDMTQKNQPLNEQVADSLGYKSGRLPLGIVLPVNSDILIIIGEDQR